MKYKIIEEEEKDCLKAKDLEVGDYFKFIEHNSIDDEPNLVFKVIENYMDSKNLYALCFDDSTSYSLRDDLEVKVVKLMPTKIEGNIIYFKEI